MDPRDRTPHGPLRLIGVIGDVHGEHEALEVALGCLRTLRVERILCVGDVADGPGDVDRCCQLLRDADVDSVLGNHDHWMLHGIMRDLEDATLAHTVSRETLGYLRGLPRTRSLPTVAGNLLLCHGLRDNFMVRLTADEYGYSLEANDDLQHLLHEGRYRLVINGHTHRRMVRSFGRLTIINAGRLVDPPGGGFAVVDLDAAFVQFYNLSPSLEVTPAARQEFR